MHCMHVCFDIKIGFGDEFINYYGWLAIHYSMLDSRQTLFALCLSDCYHQILYMWILKFLLVLYEQGETELDNVLDVLLNRDGNPNNEVIGDIVMDSGEWGRHKYKLRHFNLILQCSSTHDIK